MADEPNRGVIRMPDFTGYLAPPKDYNLDRFPKFSAAAPAIPRDKWKPIDLGADSIPVLFQKQNGCVGHGGLFAFWLAFLIKHGPKSVPPSGFSATSLYAWINGNRDQGAYVYQAMDALIANGVCTSDQMPPTQWYVSQMSAEAKATCTRFRAERAFRVSDFDAIGSALMCGFPVPFGVRLPNNFDNLDANGVAGQGRGNPRKGHCMAAYGLFQLPSGEWAFRVRNSWGEGWGRKGNCLMVESHFPGETDAFAVQAATSDPMDPNPAPVAI